MEYQEREVGSLIPEATRILFVIEYCKIFFARECLDENHGFCEQFHHSNLFHNFETFHLIKQLTVS